jgi:hypothetical protein
MAWRNENCDETKKSQLITAISDFSFDKTDHHSTSKGDMGLSYHQLDPLILF